MEGRWTGRGGSVPETSRRFLRTMASVARRFERRTPGHGEVRRILLCATGGLGNTILLEPLLRALRAGCPAARLDLLLTSRAAADLVGAMEWADRVATMPEEEWYGGTAILRRFAGPLRSERYDWVLRTFLTAPEAARASLATFLSGAPVRVAYGTAQANPFETHLLPENGAMAETDRHLALGEALGVARPADWRPASPPEAGLAWADRFIASKSAGRLLVGLHPGSDPRYMAKRWPADHFGELATRIATRLGAQPIVFGGPDDTEAVEVVMKRAGGAALAATGQDIAATAGLVSRCGAFVTNDSGLMHVAGLFGVPTVALFGPSEPIKNRPLGSGTRVVRLGLPCSPCSREYATNTCGHHDCLRTLEVEPVFAALVTTLDEARQANSGDAGQARHQRAAAGDEEIRWRR